MNVFQTVDWVCMETLRLLKNRLVIAGQFNTAYNKEFTKPYAVGDTVRVKLPQRFLIRDGIKYTPQPIERQYTTVKCDQFFGVDFEWDSWEKAISMERSEEEIRKEYAEPAAAQMHQELESRAALFAYRNTPNVVGVLGTDPTAAQTFDQARARLVELGCPAGKKIAAVSPNVSVSMSNAMVAYAEPNGELQRMYKEGSLGRIKGFDAYESVSLYQHTAGTWAGAVTMKGAGQSGSSILVNATNGDTFLQGDVVTIGTAAATVYATNPATRRSVGQAKQFTILQDAVAANNEATLSIYPAIIGPGSPYQNVNVLPANAAALTLFPGTGAPSGKVGQQGLAFGGDAFALVGVKLEVPQAVEKSAQARDPQTGLAIRFVRTWDHDLSRFKNRLDMLCGFGVLYAENGSIRILSGL